MISNLRKSGAYRLVMSGGEVFLRKDIWRLIEHARSLRMQVHIYTNGLLLDEDKLEKLAKLYPETVSVSIYSAIPEVHDEITKVPGSFNKSINALKKLNQLGIKTTIKSIQMKHTLQGYGLIENIAKSIGARYSTEINMSAGNDGSQSPLALAIDDDKKLIALAVTPKSPIFVGDASNNYSEKKRKGDEIFCSAGQNMVSISPDGKIYPCVALPLEVGNIRSDDLSQVWATSSVGQRKGRYSEESILKKDSDPLSKWQKARVSDYVECGTHNRCSWCHKCPGMGMNETGNPLAASKVQCQIANARMVGAQKLKSGMSKEEILKELGIENDFGYSTTTLAVPEMTVQFVKKTDWLKIKIKEQVSSL
jgi:radical SAM protein with 4Fe4S-binding SPASM domain